jgi:hypothetical protein
LELRDDEKDLAHPERKALKPTCQDKEHERPVHECPTGDSQIPNAKTILSLPSTSA